MTASLDRVTEVGIVRIAPPAAPPNGAAWSIRAAASAPPFRRSPESPMRWLPTHRRFADIASEVADTKIAGCVFVAHNARFDYGFLKNAIRRLGQTFRAKVLCTVSCRGACFADKRAAQPRQPDRAPCPALPHDRHRAPGEVQGFCGRSSRRFDRDRPAEEIDAAVRREFCARRAFRRTFPRARWMRSGNPRGSIDSTGSMRCLFTSLA